MFRYSIYQTCMMCLTDVNLHVSIYVKFIPCDSRENDLRTVVRIQNSNCVGIVSERAKSKQNLQIVLGSEEENA